MKLSLKVLRKINTLSQLENLGLGYIMYEIGYRGGYVGFYAQQVSNALKINISLLPSKVGVYVNYLGGGLRGSICKSSYSDKITGRKKQLLEELLNACYRAYENAENEDGLNNEYYDDNEINWDAKGTNACRNAGIKSAY